MVARLNQLKRLLQENPEDDQVLMALANAYYDAAMWDQAAGYYERGVELKPGPAALTDLGGGLFQGLLPAAPCEEVVQYYFEVWTTDTVVHHSPGDAPASFHETTAYEIAVAFADDFETDQGWTVTNDGITDGAWDRGVPVGGGAWGDPPADADGSGQCYVTDNVGGNSDVDGGTTTLTSPVMDASGPGAVIGYYRWYSNNNDGNPGNDVFVVEVSDNGGADWVELETVGPSGSQVNGGWYRKEFLVADIAGKKVNARHVGGPVGVHARNHSSARMRALGWTDRHTLRDGLEKTYPWVKEQTEQAIARGEAV